MPKSEATVPLLKPRRHESTHAVVIDRDLSERPGPDRIVEVVQGTLFGQRFGDRHFAEQHAGFTPIDSIDDLGGNPRVQFHDGGGIGWKLGVSKFDHAARLPHSIQSLAPLSDDTNVVASFVDCRPFLGLQIKGFTNDFVTWPPEMVDTLAIARLRRLIREEAEEIARRSKERGPMVAAVVQYLEGLAVA